MNALREQVLSEIEQVPDDRLQELFAMVRLFRSDLSDKQASANIREFAGAWMDMDDAVFAEWDVEWRERRVRAFSQRD